MTHKERVRFQQLQRDWKKLWKKFNNPKLTKSGFNRLVVECRDIEDEIAMLAAGSAPNHQKAQEV